MAQFLTTGQLAQELGVSPSTVRAYAAAGRIPARLTPGGHRRYVLDEVTAAFSRGTQPPSLAQLQSRRKELRALARRHGARTLAIVGSVARGEAGTGSDVDFLADFEPGRTLLDVAALVDDLEAMLGCPVDVVTGGSARGRLAHLRDEAVPL
ncbi:MAG: MerR family DNA-binding transcriptional regulator [Acidimicrobiia bacterium]